MNGLIGLINSLAEKNVLNLLIDLDWSAVSIGFLVAVALGVI